MCGLVGVVGSPLPSRAQLEGMRDALTHRGPDGAGLWSGRGAMLGHRRLSVIDPSEAGTQPMSDASGRFVLVYNGELYNDADLRQVMRETDGTPFVSSCDTETVLRWLASGRTLEALRGMYALALVDTLRRTLTLARDPLGIKPLCWARLPGRVVFASEPAAIFEHPDLSPRPDPVSVAAYLMTIRTSLGDRTMFEGVRAVEPGQALVFDLDNPDAMPRASALAWPAPDPSCSLRVGIDAGIEAHLRTDVPIGAMLSGGLDSTIIVDRAVQGSPGMRTYVAGCAAQEGDPEHAGWVADRLGTRHTRVSIDRATFLGCWLAGVEDSGLPLSTPNEIAIRLVARQARADGVKVLLTGEGADELFAGYDAPMRLALDRRQAHGRVTGSDMLEALAWIGPDHLASVVGTGGRGDAAADSDAYLAGVQHAATLYDRALGPADADERLRQLALLRRVNLVGLLDRLDRATMLESIEGRTPLADVLVASMAHTIPPEDLYDPAGTTMASRTKLALRRAFADRVPERVMQRDKASFPLPFERWIEGLTPALLGLNAGIELVSPAALAAIGHAPARAWQAAWPVFNLVLWGARWWGDGLGETVEQVRDQVVAASTRGTAASSSRVYGWTGS